MNIFEYEMIEILKKLKNEYNVVEIKAEYENEGSRQDELMRLKDIACKVDLPIVIKIGGVEAVTDIYNAIKIGANGIIAPMAETKFAVSKFINAIKTFVPLENIRDINFAINIETLTTYENLDEILSLEDFSMLSGITIGRVDFSASMNKDRNFVDTEEMYNYCNNIFKKAKAKELKCCLGGAISTNSYEFISNLTLNNLVDKFETRKIVYDKMSINNFEKAIQEGIKFELIWLKSKRNYYTGLANEDIKRIELLEKRINN